MNKENTMRIDKMSSRDISNKLYDNLFLANFSRHKSGKRIGRVTGSVRNNTSKVKVIYWDYKTGKWGDKVSSVLLNKLDFSIPESGYMTLPDGRVVYVSHTSLQRNRWNYGIHYSRLRTKMDNLSILRMYGIYTKLPDHTILTKDIAIRSKSIYFRDLFIIGTMVGTSVSLVQEAVDMFNQEELQEIYNDNCKYI